MSEFRIIGNYICNNGKLLGQGLMCTVYEAKNFDTNKYVALKQIQKRSKTDKLTAEKLKDSYDLEIKILQKCKENEYRNVIKLLDNFETHQHYNIVLELCDQNLKEYIEKKEDKRLTEKEAVEILIQIVEGEKWDIKPENILVKDGLIKITDVNLAKYIDDIQATACSFVGTLFYLAPEVQKQKKYSPYIADIYSLGVVFYEMLYGLINKSERNIDFKKKIEKSTLQINDNLKNLVLKMVEENPQNRADWSFVSSCIYQYLINQQTNSDTIQVISSFYFNAWQEKYQFLKQIITDLKQLQIKDENIYSYQSGLLIIKLLIKYVEEKVVGLYIAQNQDETLQFYKKELKELSDYRKDYFKTVKAWYQIQIQAKKQVLCQSEDLKEEFIYIERSKKFNQYFQSYLACFFIQLNQLNYQQDDLKFKKKLLQLKLLIACDQINDFEQVQILLNKSQLLQGNNILGFVQHVDNIQIVEDYIEVLQPLINQIFND